MGIVRICLASACLLCLDVSIGKTADYCVAATNGGTVHLVGWYPLNEGRGNIAHDKSWKASHGKICFAEWAPGDGDYGLEFFDPASWVSIPNESLNFTNEFSIEFWVCPFTPDYEQYDLVGNGVAWLKEGYEFFLADGQANFRLNTDKGSYRLAGTGNRVTSKRWTHLAVVYDAKVKLLALYVNGEKISQVRAEGNVVPYRRHGGFLSLGAIACGGETYRNEANRQFNGFIKNVRFYDIALNETEVFQCYEKTKDIQTSEFTFREDRAEDRLAGKLSLAIVNELGKPVGARVYVKAGGRYYGPKRLFYNQTGSMTSPAYFYALDGKCSLRVPTGAVDIVVSRGPEYYVKKITGRINNQEDHKLDVKLDRLVDMAARGWFSGDHHCHCGTHGAKRKTLAPTWDEMCKMAEAEGLSYLNVGEPVSHDRFGGENIIVKEDGGEGRSNYELGGHTHYLNVLPGQSPSSSTFCFLEAERLKTIVFLHGHGPAWDMVASPLSPGRCLLDIWTTPNAIGIWMKFNNLGIKLPISAGSDHDMNVFTRNNRPVIGGNRVYLKLKNLDWDEISHAYQNGKSFATTGPIVLLRVGENEPGDVVCLPENGADLNIQLEAYASQGIKEVELIQNGEIVKTRPAGGRPSFYETIALRMDRTCWLSAHCIAQNSDFTGNEAYTSPVYVQIGEQPIRPNQDDIQYFLKWIADYKSALSEAGKIYPALNIQKINVYLDKSKLFYEDIQGNPMKWK